MKCPLCKHQLIKGIANARRVVNGQKVLFTDVPALLCKETLTCAQTLFDSIEIEHIDQYVKKIREGEVKLQEVYPYNSII